MCLYKYICVSEDLVMCFNFKYKYEHMCVCVHIWVSMFVLVSFLLL